MPKARKRRTADSVSSKLCSRPIVFCTTGVKSWMPMLARPSRQSASVSRISLLASVGSISTENSKSCVAAKRENTASHSRFINSASSSVGVPPPRCSRAIFMPSGKVRRTASISAISVSI